MPQIVTGAFPSRGVVTEPWRPPVQRRRTRVTLKSPRCHKVLFLFIVTRGGGGRDRPCWLLDVFVVNFQLFIVAGLCREEGDGRHRKRKPRVEGGGS